MNFKEVAIKAALKAGKLILQKQSKLGKITSKSEKDILTEADIESEELILKSIQKNFQSHNIISEEKVIDKKSEHTWIIDPLDGTIFFSKGIPLYSVAIGLKHKEEMILGVVYSPVTKELFVAEKGKGAYKNRDIKLKVSEKGLLNSIVFFGCPYSSENFDATEKYRKPVHSAGARIVTLGAAVLESVLVADGISPLYYEAGLPPWDIAAGKLIVEEAGGTVRDFNGQLDVLNFKEFICGNEKAVGEFLEITRDLKY